MGLLGLTTVLPFLPQLGENPRCGVETCGQDFWLKRRINRVIYLNPTKAAQEEREEEENNRGNNSRGELAVQFEARSGWILQSGGK